MPQEQRACVYLVNDHPMYMEMVGNSIHMLRCHNPTIPVRVIFLPGSPSSTTSWFLNLCDEKSVTVDRKEPMKVEGEEAYFPINKMLLADSPEDRILFIDSDTFIFRDVAQLFDTYQGFQAVGCWNKWVYNRGWKDKLLGVKPMNSGVMLWNTKVLKQACLKLPEYCRELRAGKTALSKWLIELNQDCWQREELAYSMFIERHAITHRYFDRKDCINILYETDFDAMKETAIFHCYTQQWRATHQRLKREPMRVPRWFKKGANG